MITTIACEKCGISVPADAITYSPDGQQVCSSCLAKGQIAESEARGEQSRRTTRNALIAGGVLVVAIPTLMVAAGAGRHVATALMVLGAAALLGGRSARRMYVVRNSKPDPIVARGTALVMLGGLALVILGAVLQSAFSRR